MVKHLPCLIAASAACRIPPSVSPLLHSRVLFVSLAAVLLLAIFDPSKAEARVGVTSAVNPAAKGTPPAGSSRILRLGQNVVHNERVETDADGLVQILLLDGTTFTVGPNSTLIIDKFVYDPDRSTAELAATAVKGTFRMIGGLASKGRGTFSVKTPSATMGIRGGMVEAAVTGSSTLVSLIFGKEVVVRGAFGKRRLFEPGYTLELSNDAGGPRITIRRRSLNEANSFRQRLAGRPGQRGGAQRRSLPGAVKNSPLGRVNLRGAIGRTGVRSRSTRGARPGIGRGAGPAGATPQRVQRAIRNTGRLRSTSKSALGLNRLSTILDK